MLTKSSIKLLFINVISIILIVFLILQLPIEKKNSIYGYVTALETAALDLNPLIVIGFIVFILILATVNMYFLTNEKE